MEASTVVVASSHGIFRCYAFPYDLPGDTWEQLIDSVLMVEGVTEAQQEDLLLLVVFPPRVSVEELDQRVLTAMQIVIPDLTLDK